MLDLRGRAQALTEAFFTTVDGATVDAVRAAKRGASPREAVALASGLTDEALLDRLAELALPSDVWFAVSLLPLLEVAWADGEIQEPERDAILRGAAAHGIEPDTPRARVLAAHLDRPPDRARLVDLWRGTVAAVVEHLTAKQRKQLMAEIVERARGVAEAAGGILGLASVCSDEEGALEAIRHAFVFPEQFADVFSDD